MTSGLPWTIKGSLIGACSCDWGCPCNFNAPPTNGWCQGSYNWFIETGHYGEVSLDGLHMSWVAHSPGPLHEGHVTAQFVVDAKGDEPQRSALLAIMSGAIGGPFAILASVTETLLDPVFAPYAMTVNGLESEVRIPGILELSLAPIPNPVTGNPEELQLVKPTGFTSKLSHLGTAIVNRYTGGIKHDHSGKYAEFAPVEYSWP